MKKIRKRQSKRWRSSKKNPLTTKLSANFANKESHSLVKDWWLRRSVSKEDDEWLGEGKLKSKGGLKPYYQKVYHDLVLDLVFLFFLNFYFKEVDASKKAIKIT